LRDKVVKTPWQSRDLPPTSPCDFLWTRVPFTGSRTPSWASRFCGAYVNRAARIEPIPPKPGLRQRSLRFALSQSAAENFTSITLARPSFPKAV
jgi:hypothetical protein